MKWGGISFRTEGRCSVGVYRTNEFIGQIFFGTDKTWHFSIYTHKPDKPVPTLTIGEMRDIIGMMGTLDRTDNYGWPMDSFR